MAINIKVDDLFAVQRIESGVDKGVGKYSGAQFEEDVLDIVSTSNFTGATSFIQPGKPPLPGTPDFAVPGDFWFDTEIFQLFIAVLSSDSGNDPAKYDWVVTDVGQITTAGDGVTHIGQTFPHEPADKTQITHQNGVTYTYYAFKKQWLFLENPLYDSVTALGQDKVNVSGDTVTGKIIFKDTSNRSYSQFYNNGLMLGSLYGDQDGKGLRLDAKENAYFKITQNNLSTGAQQTVMRTYESDGTCKIFKLRDPTDPEHATNKRYVDNKVGNGPFVESGSSGIKITKSGNTYYIEGP